ncbi:MULTISPECIES: hypothetical protein [Bacillaceae]|nr:MULTISPECIES: hypothetical protein [Bacillaceae]
MKKKRLFIPLAILLTLSCWVLISITLPPKWVGMSETELWVADFNQEPLAKTANWFGQVYWHGHLNVSLIGVELYHHGKLLSETRKKNTYLGHNDAIDYMHTADAAFDRDDQLELIVKWEANSHVYEESIPLQSRKRFFALPSFLNPKTSAYSM